MDRRPAYWLLLLVWLLQALEGMGQATSSSYFNFSVEVRAGKPIISWTNSYENVAQISVQRSSDSLSGFRTIVTMPDPSLAANGYMDISAPDTRQYYRIYVQLPYGRFFVTGAKQPVVNAGDPLTTPRSTVVPTPQEPLKAPDRMPQKTIVPVKPPVLQRTEDSQEYDQILKKSKLVYVKKLPWRHLQPGDPLSLVTDQLTAVLPTNLFTPSPFLFTNNEGNVVMAMPTHAVGRYSVHFFLPEGTPLFHFDMSKEPVLIVDKVNFQRSGWFDFEIRQDGKVKERNRIFIPKLRL